MKNVASSSASAPAQTYRFKNQEDQEKLLPGTAVQVRIVKLCVAIISTLFLIFMMVS